MQKNKARVLSRFIIQGTIRLTSPLMIGGGETLGVDMAVIKNSNGKPYIPATSMAGVLKHFFYEELNISNRNEQYNCFWGFSEKNNSMQSAFQIEDLPAINKTNVVLRDGIQISHATGTVKEKGKFDYEVVEPGAEFRFSARVVQRADFCEDTFLKIITSMVWALREGKISLGAMTTKGFGRCKLTDYAVYQYDYSKPNDVIAWLKRNEGDEQKVLLNFDNIYATKEDDFSLDATFNIKTSLLIQSYTSDPSEPDTVHIKSQGKPVLPGTSVKGVLRARAVKIINTLGGHGEEMVKNIFGWAPDKAEDNSQKIKSRLIVEETDIKNADEEIQFRIGVDRFTGGVMEGSLFDSMPLWPTGFKEQITISLKIKKYKQWEIGLILLLLKDLWCGDLALGSGKGVGRGVLTGRRAELGVGAKTYTIVACDDMAEQESLKITEQSHLENFVQAFVQKCGEGEAAHG